MYGSILLWFLFFFLDVRKQKELPDVIAGMVSML